MRYHQFTNELFDNGGLLNDKEYTVKWRKNNQKHTVTAKVFKNPDNRDQSNNDYDYLISYDNPLLEVTFFAVYNGVIMISFSRSRPSILNPEDTDQRITGQGDQYRIFATVMEIISKYAAKYTPDYFIFQARESSRQSLYAKMIIRYAHNMGYRQVPANNLPGEYYDFLLKNREVNKSLLVLQRNNINEDEGRRNFLKGAGAALGLGALGYGAYKQKTGPNAPGSGTSDENRGDKVATQPTKADAPTVSQPVVPKYSPEQLKDYIIAYARKYLPADQVIPFIAQVSHESHGFRSLEENLNYSAERLSKLYPKLFPPKLAARVVASPDRDQIISNTIYGNRMGNNEPGDGYKYRGRGYIMLTGKENYEKMGRSLNIDLVNNPDLASQPNYAAQIAVSYWNTRVVKGGKIGNIAQVTKKIAGSSKQGIKSRTEKLKRYTRELGDRVLPKKKSK